MNLARLGENPDTVTGSYVLRDINVEAINKGQPRESRALSQNRISIVENQRQGRPPEAHQFMQQPGRCNASFCGIENQHPPDVTSAEQGVALSAKNPPLVIEVISCAEVVRRRERLASHCRPDSPMAMKDQRAAAHRTLPAIADSTQRSSGAGTGRNPNPAVKLAIFADCVIRFLKPFFSATSRANIWKKHGP